MNINVLKTNKYLLFLSFLTLFFIIFIFYLLTNINNNEQLISKLENSLIYTKNIFEEEKKYALSLAILLSKDKEIIDSFLKKDRKESFILVNKKISTLKKLQNSDIEVQIHNKELNTYLRSWDFSIKDIPLSSFRQGLVKVKESLEPLVSIELGKRLNIKAISPLIVNNKFVGSIEIIINFKGLTKKLHKNSLDMYVLLDNKYLNEKSELTNNQKINDFILINQDMINSNIFKDINLRNLEDYGYFTNENLAFSYFTFYSLDREKLGYVIISSKNNKKTQVNSSYKKQINNTNHRIIIE
ncbi:MAG: cache domain-containing protein [Poseidonibacter sp.]|uniref:cache domain-containing protein n=1 Tax=Poseidonibacter sp. TaxID=2321188 RepID=UPI00359EBA5F